MHKERATVLASWRWCTMLQPILAKTMPRAGKALCGHREEGAQRARRAVVRTKDERGVTVGRKARNPRGAWKDSWAKNTLIIPTHPTPLIMHMHMRGSC